MDHLGGEGRQVRCDDVRLRQSGNQQWRVAGPGEQAGGEAGALRTDRVPDVSIDHAAGGWRHLQLLGHHVIEDLRGLVGPGRLDAELPLEVIGESRVLQRGLPPRLEGEFVRVTIRKPASLNLFRPSLTSAWAGMINRPSFNASMSAGLTLTLWMSPTISNSPCPSEKKSL